MAKKDRGNKVEQSAPKSGKIRVRAKAVGGKPTTSDKQVVGYYDNQRKRIGDVFEVEAKDFSERWMERVGDGAVSTEREETGRAEVALSQVNPATGEKKQ